MPPTPFMNPACFTRPHYFRLAVLVPTLKRMPLSYIGTSTSLVNTNLSLSTRLTPTPSTHQTPFNQHLSSTSRGTLTPLMTTTKPRSHHPIRTSSQRPIKCKRFAYLPSTSDIFATIFTTSPRRTTLLHPSGPRYPELSFHNAPESVHSLGWGRC